MSDTRATSLVSAERESLSDDFISFGPDAPTILPGWGAQDLLEHLIIRERRPALMVGPKVPIPAVADWAEQERAKLTGKDWAEQVEIFRRGPGRFSPVRGLDSVMNTGEYFVHHEDLRRARPGWEPRDLGEQAERQLWGMLRTAGRVLVSADVDVTLVSPHGGVRIPARGSQGSVRVHGPASEILLWAFGRDRVARVSVEGSPESIQVLHRGDRGA